MQYPDNSIITLDHVWKRYDNKVILKDVNLDIQKGDFVAVTGPNGGGKTTLLRIILRLLNPTQGKVTYHSDNMEVKKLPIGYLPQKNLIDSRFPITVRETVASGLLAEKNMQRDECNKRIAETISLMGLDAHSDASIGDLSGGQLQRTTGACFDI
ncbi:ATP-binding cassette domain-containing protein [uncultured Muribaculum sp.]|uniref:ATP-binding cassette domain-containing protein n=1 Tax=uncultured Muribaculum sp. TaxID=1918613 RepID=UPI0025B76718|nr:ATP-binding cassette domain-containing protein [uncultured Muribaculum sp.]